MSKKTSDPKAADLLPPDGPPPVDPKKVMRSDDPLEPEVETRKIGIRRVPGLDFGNWLYGRVNWRPAGNSRRFWKQIEADDPFLKAPARPTDGPLEVYAAQRIQRTEGSLPKPQPEVARAYPPSRREDTAPAVRAPETPRKPRKPKPTPAPEPTHTPEPRPAPTPQPPQAAAPEPEPEAPAPVPPPSPLRHLPPKPAKRTKTGRLRTSRQPMNRPGDQAKRPSAAEIRAAKEKAWQEAKGEKAPAEAPKRSMDEYRNWIQLMEAQQAAHERGEEIPTSFAGEADLPKKKVEIKGEAKRKKVSPAEKAAIKAAQAPRPPATPQEAKKPVPAPKPAPASKPEPKEKKPEPKEKKPVDRSAKKPAGLDDLFGGAQEGRVRIGKRSKPKPEGSDDS